LYRKQVGEYGLNDIVIFQDHRPHDEVIREAAGSDLLLLFIGKGQGHEGVYTGKIFEYIRLDVPVLAMVPVPGDAEALIRSTGTGLAVDFDDTDSIRDGLSRYYDLWQKRILRKEYLAGKNREQVRQYERRLQAGEFSAVFEKVLSRRSLP
jgi:glycosyltransferase involved in cell wall biosynthesis